jgi:hypothetical protein
VHVLHAFQTLRKLSTLRMHQRRDFAGTSPRTRGSRYRSQFDGEPSSRRVRVVLT